MAKNKNLTDNDLIKMYIDYILKHDEKPVSIYLFAKQNNFEEAVFYKHYANFNTLEQRIFKSFIEQTIELLGKSEDYINYDARNKLLSFYFTFFELLTANRSYVAYTLNNNSKIKIIKLFTTFKKVFKDYIGTLEIERIDIPQKQLVCLQHTCLKEGAWIQLMLTLKFWLDDTSPSFEKTDMFIEKSVNTSFDIINIQPLKSFIDFGKFIFKEKIMTT
ncbi:MAG: hypothetical protein ACJAV9_000485 [Urechidicola sp.]|jgi:hypothetical protein